MTQTIPRTARFALLLAAGFVLGTAAISLANISGAKYSLLSKLGVANVSANGPVADSTVCAVPKDSSRDIYFVSCGGFF